LVGVDRSTKNVDSTLIKNSNDLDWPPAQGSAEMAGHWLGEAQSSEHSSNPCHSRISSGMANIRKLLPHFKLQQMLALIDVQMQLIDHNAQ
jgi:hypothetical protein